MNTAIGTCRIGDDDQDRPCEVALDNGPGLKSWWLDTYLSREEHERLLSHSQPVFVEISLDGGSLTGKALLERASLAPAAERSDDYPLSAHMLGSGPLTEEDA